MSQSDIDKLEALMSHIGNVQEACFKLGKKLILAGETIFGRRLIQNSQVHDLSKFFGTEWDYLTTSDCDRDKLSLAVHQHNSTNPHHPEYWPSIKAMDRLYIAEMVCDWKSRSSEKGTDLRQWIDTVATERFGFTKEDEVYAEIMHFVDLLLEPLFQPMT